jgi:anti-repressor protein
MNDLVIKSDKGNAVTTSLLVAQKFGKEHKNVLASIREMISSAENSAQYYYSGSYRDENGIKFF